jgi:hypothetical protein
MIKGSGVRGGLFAAVFGGIIALATTAVFMQPRTGAVHGPFLSGGPATRTSGSSPTTPPNTSPSGYREVQVSLGSTPTVGVRVQGSGNNLTYVGLAVGI